MSMDVTGLEPVTPTMSTFNAFARKHKGQGFCLVGEAVRQLRSNRCAYQPKKLLMSALSKNCGKPLPSGRGECQCTDVSSNVHCFCTCIYEWLRAK